MIFTPIIDYTDGVYVSDTEASVLRNMTHSGGAYYNPVTDTSGRYYISVGEAKLSTNPHPLCVQIKRFYPIVQNIPFYIYLIN